MAHGALLAVHFVAPTPAPVKPTDPGLEVILVNAKHSKAPLKADALAQANLDGGGTVDKGRSKSPMPDMRKMETGDSIKAAKRRIAELEEQQKNLLTQAAKQTAVTAPPVTEKNKPDPLPTGSDLLESSKAIARRVAEISETIEDQNKRPKKTMITPSTREAGYASYYKAMQKRIEDTGTLNFPQVNGRKLYGQLMLSIPVFQDGTIYDKEGIKVERSSGNPALDEAAIRIVRRSAPFGKFPPNMLSVDRDDLWVVVTTFKFTREDKLQADLSGGGR
ncbi:TonB family protein [Duganella sp. HH105]|uniref:TonB family protein n=1 Tax=Duganella sp. HH105 TaxID=1781067 RepID=UPI000877B4BF|nr:TonB family protein [Duganella sp. HH105]